jgi:hypothetical protein
MTERRRAFRCPRETMPDTVKLRVAKSGPSDPPHAQSEARWTRARREGRIKNDDWSKTRETIFVSLSVRLWDRILG